MAVGITLDASKLTTTNTTVTTIDGYHDVPSADSSDNVVIRDVVGNKTDTHDGDSLYAGIHSIDKHIHTASNVYPTLAAGTTVTGAAGAWTLGTFAEVVPASTITDDFDVHFVSIEDISANGIYELVLYAATTEIARSRFAKTAVVEATLNIPVQTAIQPANTQIQAKVASASGGGDTVDISLFYHTY